MIESCFLCVQWWSFSEPAFLISELLVSEIEGVITKGCIRVAFEG